MNPWQFDRTDWQTSAVALLAFALLLMLIRIIG